jgi:hypothetical protein
LLGAFTIGGVTTLVLIVLFGAPTGGLEDFGFWFFAGAAWFVGAYVGLALGCWHALRRGQYEWERATARMSVVFGLLWWLVSGPASAAGEAVGLSVVATGLGSWLVGLAVSPVLARLVVLRSVG